ncbi:MAG: carboxylating nicotinate-nucleotide diphosphorylase [Flavobacteriaceae bacterium]|nr:carboxylating nicotinate-nucleotide diphosphorylase [Flavobacteriaceae bacterium]
MPENYYKKYQTEFEGFIDTALKEDIGSGDHSSLSCIDPQSRSKAELLTKQAGILGGMELTAKIFQRYDPLLQFDSLLTDGSKIKPGQKAFTISGSTLSILATERLVLNSLQRMSGIATLTHRLSQKIKHTQCKLLDTRKTTPNFRHAEKWAVLIGGGQNHRMGLFDALMIKDNHVDFCGGMTQALQKTEAYLRRLEKTLEVVVECRNSKEIEATLRFSFVSRILLDNHSIPQLKEALVQIDNQKPTEASGNITEDKLVAVAETGVNFISMGALTYDAKSIDLSLKAV